MNWTFLLTQFEGRIGRGPFWAGFALLLGCELPCHLLAYALEGDRLSAIVDLAFTYFWLALFLKRANDRNLSALFVAAFFLIAFLMDALVMFGGGVQQPLMLLLLVPYLVVGLVLLVELGLRPGVPR